MGQRHQLFIIARINDRYRGLAAVHHQWLYGTSAVRRRLRLLAIFGCPQNREVLTSELQGASKLPATFWEAKKTDHRIPEQPPFPYIQTCLTIAAAWDPRDSYFHQVHTEPFNMGFSDGDNNDGITILDITDLSRLRSAFVQFDNENEELDMRPLTDGQYLQYYYKNVDDLGFGYRGLLDDSDFDYSGLLDVGALRGTWPEGEWKAAQLDSNTSDETDKKTAQGNAQSTTLKTIALDKFFLEILSSSAEEFASSLQHAQLIPGFWSSIKSKLYNDPEVLLRTSQTTASQLLAGALENETMVNLTPFQLTDEQVDSVLSKHTTLVSLNISGNTNITRDVLQKILGNNPDLSTLYLLNMPQITLPEKLRLIRDTKISDFLDTELLALPLKRVDNEFYILDPPEDIKLETKAFVSQIIVTAIGGEDGRDDIYTPDGGIQIHKLVHIHSRTNYSLPFDLDGIIVPPLPFFSSLTEFIKHCSNTDPERTIAPYADFGRALAFCFATDKNRVRNMPSLYRHLIVRRTRCANKLSDGEWSLLLVIEGPYFGPERDRSEFRETYSGGYRPRAIRYAFLSAEPETASDEQKGNSNAKVIKEDLKGFLDRTVEAPELRKGLLDDWADNFGGIYSYFPLNVCGMEEVESYLNCPLYVGKS